MNGQPVNTTTLSGAAGLALLLLAGCATTPETHPALERARDNVEQAVADRHINRLASVELNRARERLERAETAHEQGASTNRVGHLAYLADRQADIARETARLRQLENRIDQLGETRKRIQLEARAARAEREAERAEARRDLAEAERLRAEATAAAEAAERARAQQSARESEQARERAQAERQQAEEQRMLAEQRAAELERQTAEMEDRARRLQEQIAELEARPTDRGLVLTLGSDVLFDFDKAELKSGAQRTVDRIAEFLDEYEDRQVLVEGFTDAVGARQYNMQLSLRRANAVRDALVERGVDADRIRVHGYGPDHPVAANDSDAGRQLNRRVEVIISEDEQAVPERE